MVLTTFFYQRCWSILYSFSELIYSDQSIEYKRLNSTTNYMPEGTLTNTSVKALLKIHFVFLIKIDSKVLNEFNWKKGNFYFSSLFMRKV